MPKIIFTSRYIKGGSHGGSLVNYMATRDGVVLPYVVNGNRPATQNQQRLISEVLRAIPETAELFEYEDYKASPTVANASALISTAFEQNPELWGNVRNYVEYIARRPGVKKSELAGHGLWNDSDQPISLAKAVHEVENHKGNLWTHVISLRRDDAERMGYTDTSAWRDLVLEQLPTIAKAMKIPMEDLRFYAAYHDKASNPHIHMIVYSRDPTRGFLTEPGIEKMRSSFARSIYKDEYMHTYQRKDMVRSELNQFADERLKELAASIDSGDTEIGRMLLELGEQLRHSKGKKQYGYLKPALKAQVDEIVRRLANDPRIDEMYQHWCELNGDIKRMYTSKVDASPPLEHEKTFKTIKNMVIRQSIATAEYVQTLDAPGESDIMPENVLPEVLPEPEELYDEADTEVDSATFEDDADYHVTWTPEYKLARKYLFGQNKDFDKAYELFIAEAESGNTLALHDLGHMHQRGLGCTEDMDAAQEWYKKAFHAFSAAEEEKTTPYLQYRLGKFHRDGLGTEQDYISAVGFFERAAKANHAYAQYSLGSLYKRGLGVVQDNAEALDLFTKSADQGNPYAAYEVAGMQEKGIAALANVETAGRYYKMAFQGFLHMEANGSDDKLQHRLGKMLLHGKGTEPDLNRAAEYFRKATEGKNTYAQYALAKLILADKVQGDKIVAIRWMQNVAVCGDEHAQYSLGKLYLSDEHKDVTQAIHWLKATANQGNQYAQYTLGKVYLSDEHRDILQAMRWLKAAADQNNEYAQYALGKVYLSDEHKDISQAMRWLKAAADQNNEYAQYAFGKLYLSDEHKDISQALRWLKAAADQNNQYAQYQLGKIYLKGDGVERDEAEAVRYFTLSAAQGNEQAQWFLDHMHDYRGPGAGTLLRHLAQMLQQDYSHQRERYEQAVDRKLLAKIRRKQQEQGQKFE